MVGFNPFNAGCVFDRLVWIIENEKRNQTKYYTFIQCYKGVKTKIKCLSLGRAARIYCGKAVKGLRMLTLCNDSTIRPNYMF